MSARFAELASRDTPMGVLSLRWRLEPSRHVDVYEVKLGDEFLMSSLFTVAEIELARLGLASMEGDDLDVVVGGLGLGYTACAVLEDPRVRSLIVVEAMPDVIAWHEDELLPDVRGLVRDPRCRLELGDFFALARSDNGFEPNASGRRFDVVLVDIDHTPNHVLDPSHADFYTPDGLRRMARYLRDGGVFALWSDDPPEDRFLGVLRETFAQAHVHVVSFPNFYTSGQSSNTVYVAQ